MRKEMMGVRFTPQEIEVIRSKADKMGLTVASFLRMASLKLCEQIQTEGNLK